MTRISIIIPCYNGEEFLAECLESAVNQTHEPHEVIVVDDGSSDRSKDIAASFDKVTLIKQPNQGVSVARNNGIRAATGDYLMFLDDDDLLEKHALESLVEAVQGEMRVLGIMGTAWFDSNPDKPFKIEPDPPAAFFPRIIRGNLGCNPNRILPREIAEQVGGFAAGMPIYEDWHFWYRVALCNLPIRCTRHVGAFVRRDPNSCLRGADERRVAHGHLRVLKDISTDMLKRPDLIARWGDELFWSAWTAYRRASELGIDSSDSKELAKNIREITRRGPKSVCSSRLGRMVRLIGARAAIRIQGLTQPRHVTIPDLD